MSHRMKRWIRPMLVLPALLLAPAQASDAGERLRWSFQLDSPSSGEFLGVGPDATVYATDQERLYALSPQGILRWTLPGAGGGRPIDFGFDGTVYTGTRTTVVAVDPDGSIVWEYDPAGVEDIVAGPGVGPDGNIYAVQNTLVEGIGIFALDPQGNLLWSDPGDPAVASFPGGNSRMALASLDDDRIYFGAPTQGSAPPGIWAFDYGGDQQWSRFGADAVCNSIPLLDPQGRIVLRSSASCGIRTLDRQGSTVWVAPTPSTMSSLIRPTIGSDGVIYTAEVFGGGIWAVDASGSTRWVVEGNHGIMRNLGVSPDNAVLVDGGSLDPGTPGLVRGFDTSDGSHQWTVELPPDGGVQQRTYSIEPAFSEDSRTAYVTTRLAGDVAPGFVHAIDITTTLVGVQTPSIESAISLRAAHPNPFPTTTRLTLEVSRAGTARLAVYDARGRLVRTLLSEQELSIRTHTVEWDGRSDRGVAVPPGVYHIRLTMHGNTYARRLVRLY